jgi:hypothetical protein
MPYHLVSNHGSIQHSYNTPLSGISRPLDCIPILIYIFLCLGIFRRSCIHQFYISNVTYFNINFGMQKCRINSTRGKFHLRRRLVFSFNIQINVRENRRGNQEWKIQRHWHHWVHKTPDEDKQIKITTQKTKMFGHICWLHVCAIYWYGKHKRLYVVQQCLCFMKQIRTSWKPVLICM